MTCSIMMAFIYKTLFNELKENNKKLKFIDFSWPCPVYAVSLSAKSYSFFGVPYSFTSRIRGRKPNTKIVISLGTSFDAQSYLLVREMKQLGIVANVVKFPKKLFQFAFAIVVFTEIILSANRTLFG